MKLLTLFALLLSIATAKDNVKILKSKRSRKRLDASFYYQTFAFMSMDTYSSSILHPLYSLLGASDDTTAPHFAIDVQITPKNPTGRKVPYTGPRTIEGFIATFVGRVTAARTGVPDLCAIATGMDANDPLYLAIDDNAYANFIPFAVDAPPDGAEGHRLQKEFAFTDTANVASDGVWVATVQVCPSKRRFRTHMRGKALPGKRQTFKRPWLETHVEINGRNPFGFESAERFYEIPGDMFAVLGFAVLGAAFAAQMWVHRTQIGKYHYLLLMATALWAISYAGNLWAHAVSNGFSRDRIRPALTGPEVFAIIARVVAGGWMRLAFGLLCIGHGVVIRRGHRNEQLTSAALIGGLVVAYIASASVFQLKTGAALASHDSTALRFRGDLRAWLLLTAVVDTCFFYFSFEHVVDLIDTTLKAQSEYHKLKLYRRVAMVLSAVFAASICGTLVHFNLPFDRYLLRPSHWLLCYLLDRFYWSAILLAATAAMLWILKPHHTSRLQLEFAQLQPVLLNEPTPVVGETDKEMDEMPETPAQVFETAGFSYTRTAMLNTTV